MDVLERLIVEWGRNRYWDCNIQDFKALLPGQEPAIDKAVANLRRHRILKFSPDGYFAITNHGISVMGWDGPFLTR